MPVWYAWLYVGASVVLTWAAFKVTAYDDRHREDQ